MHPPIEKSSPRPLFDREIFRDSITRRRQPFPDTAASMIRIRRTRQPTLAAVARLVILALPHLARGEAFAFNRDIQPILAAKCFACHGVDNGARKAGLRLDTKEGLFGTTRTNGPVVTPGRPEVSELWRRVNSGDPGISMPPGNSHKALTAAEKNRLRAWIAGGAPWQPHWALIPPVQAAVPQVRDARWKGNPIDAFVRAKLSEHGLSPAPEADRGTLLRRATYDLTGLPPTPGELEGFLSDHTKDAWDKVVTRLLASPAYGERWARHWLDVARFGESQGFEYDRIRENAWRYRDYVIRAFNNDIPYDQFIREQLAGDVLPGAGPDQVTATGFLVAGPMDQAGNGSASPSIRAMTREAELEDMVGAVAQSFLGLTVNCARCHDHKFDPIAQRDYYAMKAVFQGVKHGDRELPGGARGSFAYAANPEKPGATFILARGEPGREKGRVAPSGVECLGPGADLGLTVDAGDAERRRKFADWVASPQNPLTARVIVNRVWQHHFGRGIVATPNDFGRLGEAPSHPELLDWLAAWFADPAGGAWRIKRLQRLIVTSAAYRESGRMDARAGATDADNRYLWRHSPQRLEAEAVRDAMLAVSGELNPAEGGPGFRPFRHVSNGGQNEYFAADLPGSEQNRRTVYRIAVHSARDPMLDALDCPEFSTRTPVRPVTTTPLQALALMNGSFVQRQAARLADRVEREAGGGMEARIRLLWMIALNREPRPAELREGVAFARTEGLATAAWAVLNSNEFLHVR
jgi:Protein of unknown function (DUF1549)/Protein of unknown function (DUF1553)/Planctomycete cytochrome C